MDLNKHFLTPYERRKRIEVCLKLKDWTWHKLAKEMNMYPSTVHTTFKVGPHSKKDLKVDTVKRCALALGVPAGFLIDKKVD